MKDITIKQLFDAKIHFGHTKRFTSPKMKNYIYDTKNKLSIINLDMTLNSLKKAIIFIENVIKKNGIILMVGTKKQASILTKNYAEKIKMPYVTHRWLGGLLTNYKTMIKSIEKLKTLEKNIEEKKFDDLKKKEILGKVKDLNKLKIKFDGIKNMGKIPDAIFVIDTNYEKTAIEEARKLKIPIIGIVDTNCNPEHIDYIIPGNDDSPESINFYLEVISNHIIESKKK